MEENQLSYKIRGAIYKVNTKLGPGLLESIYVKALCCELIKQGLEVEREVGIHVYYDEENLGVAYRMDILVNKRVIVEVKSVEDLCDVHHKQLLTYLKLSDKKLGILVNFNEADINDGIHRKVNGL